MQDTSFDNFLTHIFSPFLKRKRICHISDWFWSFFLAVLLLLLVVGFFAFPCCILLSHTHSLSTVE